MVDRDVSDVLVSFMGPWYTVDSFCGNSDRPVVWSVRRPPVVLPQCRILPWYADAKYRMNSLRGDISGPTKLNCCIGTGTFYRLKSILLLLTILPALWNGIGGGNDVTLTVRRAVDAAAALCVPGTTAACAEHDGISFPVTTVVVAADRTATRCAHQRQGTQPFIYTAPEPSMTRPAIAMFPVVLLKSKTVLMIPIIIIMLSIKYNSCF